MNRDIERILYTEDDIFRAVKETGSIIAADYAGKNPLMVCILRGSAVFFADLIRAVQIPLEIDFMAAASYGMEAKTSGRVEILQDLRESIENRHVVIVEDIIDSGITLNHLIELLKKRSPASIKVAALIDKNVPRKISFKADYTCFSAENEFIVGYGLDYGQKYRNLPYIGVLKREIYN